MLQLYVLSFSFLLIASSDFITLFMQVIADLASHSRENAFFTPDYENWYIVPTTKAWQIALVQFFLLRVYLVTILLLEGAFQFWSFGGQSVKRLIIGGWKVFFFFPRLLLLEALLFYGKNWIRLLLAVVVEWLWRVFGHSMQIWRFLVIIYDF